MTAITELWEPTAALTFILREPFIHLAGTVLPRIWEKGLTFQCSENNLEDWILSTILLALFRAKFACILAISNPVFRWESCKGSVWESVKKCSRFWKEERTRDWILQVARGLEAARSCTRAKHVVKLNHHASYNTIRQKVQSGHSVTSRLELVAQSSCEAKPPANSILKNWLFAFHSHPSIYTPYINEM